MGIHRNVIHPKFGNFILLATILVDAPITSYGEPLDYSPCLECKLCVAACPVGAIGKDGEFDFVACSVHNYREFMGGFTDWVQTIADSEDAADFRSRVTDSENASMWQSLSFKANYKAAYCLAVCPAGEDVIEPYLDDRKGFMDLVLKPLQDKQETLYVLPNSDAKAHAEKRFPHKPVKVVDSGITRPASCRPARVTDAELPGVHGVLRRLQAQLDQQLGGVGGLLADRADLRALGGGEVLQHERRRDPCGPAAGRCRCARAESPWCPTPKPPNAARCGRPRRHRA